MTAAYKPGLQPTRPGYTDESETYCRTCSAKLEAGQQHDLRDCASEFSRIVGNIERQYAELLRVLAKDSKQRAA